MWVDPYSSKEITDRLLKDQEQADAYRNEYALTSEDTSSSAGIVDRAKTAWNLMRFQTDSYDYKVSDAVDAAYQEYLKMRGQ